MNTRSLRTLLALSLGSLLGAGCTESTMEPATDAGAPDGAPPLSCPAEGMGALTVAVTGLPAGVAGAVTVTGADGMARPVTPGTPLSLPAGAYTIAAAKVTVADPIVRPVYAPTLSPATLCVNGAAGATAAQATVSYALVPTSHKVWVGNTTGGTGTLLGFASDTLRASGMPAATVPADTRGSKGFAFDRDGNVWIIGGTTADPPLARYPAGMLGTGGRKTADVVVDSPAFKGGLPGPLAVAFDPAGNLWVSISFARKVVRFTPDQLTQSGAPVPAVEIAMVEAPAGLAFDAEGNLWIGYAGGIAKMRADRLGASAMAPSHTYALRTGPPVVVNLRGAAGLAFDAADNLWAVMGGAIVRLTPAERAEEAGAAMKMLTPSVVIEADVTALPHGLAFDEGGGLWVAYNAGRFVRFAPDALTTGGRKTPGTVIASPTLGYAQWFGLYPAPAALPLYHRMP
jgi:sugar lactone lactonase YvrE